MKVTYACPEGKGMGDQLPVLDSVGNHSQRQYLQPVERDQHLSVAV